MAAAAMSLFFRRAAALLWLTVVREEGLPEREAVLPEEEGREAEGRLCSELLLREAEEAGLPAVLLESDVFLGGLAEDATGPRL